MPRFISTPMSRTTVLLVGVCISLALSSLLLNSCGPTDGKDDPQPENEDVFINEVYSAGDDWVELYNASSAEKDIGGYKIFDDATDKYTIPANTTIPANGFLILLADGTGTGLHTNFKVSSDGETIYLENAGGKLIDKMIVPALKTGQSYGRYPDGSLTLSVSGNTTKGSSNNGANGPAFSDVTRTPLVPRPADAVTVSFGLTSAVEIEKVEIHYHINDEAFVAFDVFQTGGVYKFVIPAENKTGEVEYYILARNKDGITTRSPADPTHYHDYLLNDDALPALVINEFLASNTSCCPDVENNVDEFDDWIEIYNAGDTPVNIAGMYLSDDLTNPFGSKIPADSPEATTIPAKGYLVLWADDSKDQGPLHLNFKLSATGEAVGLYYIDGRTIDSYTFGAQDENKSYGRSTDGASTWKQFATPTPGATNQ